MAPPPIQEEPLSPTNSKRLVDDLIRMDSENDFHKPGAELRILRQPHSDWVHLERVFCLPN